jgi:hypothetical protein
VQPIGTHPTWPASCVTIDCPDSASTSASRRVHASLLAGCSGAQQTPTVANPLSIVKSSVKESGWSIATVKPAGSAASGKRQSLHFARTSSAAKDEYDVWARGT